MQEVITRKRAKALLGTAAAGVLVCGVLLAGCQSGTAASSSSSSASTSASSAAASSSTSTSVDANSNVIEVTIDDTSCKLTANKALSGTVTFNVTNAGTAVNEFEILAEDKLQIVNERENLAPGTTTEVTCVLQPGTYFTASKTNMVGPLIDATEFIVEDSGEEVVVSSDEQELRDMAVTNYTAYVRDQAGQLLEETKKFAELYKTGKVDEAKEAYAPVRMYYERIEPTAEAFGDIDPNLDLREADAAAGDLEDMADWRGWHAIEKDLWADANWDDAKKAELADALVADTQKLYDLVYSDEFEVSLDEISNGAIGLLEEVMVSKITGEEEAFSHTDFWDFKANVEGAQVAYGNVKELAKLKDPEAVEKIDQAFEDLEAELAKYEDGQGGYLYYDKVQEESPDGIKVLTDKIEALRQPLSDLTAIILS